MDHKDFVIMTYEDNFDTSPDNSIFYNKWSRRKNVTAGQRCDKVEGIHDRVFGRGEALVL